MRGDRDHITVMNQFPDEYFYHAGDYRHPPSEYEPAATTYGYHHTPAVKNDTELYYFGQSAAMDPYGYDAAGYCGGYGDGAGSPYDAAVATCNGSWSSSQEYSSGTDGQPYGCGWTSTTPPDHGPQQLDLQAPLPLPSPAALPAVHVAEPLSGFGDDPHRRPVFEHGFLPERVSDQTAFATTDQLFSEYILYIII